MKKILAIASAFLFLFASPLLALTDECNAQIKLAENAVLARDNGMTQVQLAYVMIDSIQNPIVMKLFSELAETAYTQKSLTAEQVARKTGWYCIGQ